MPSNSLWCDIPDIDHIKTPSSMLNDQCSALAEMTNGRLMGKVKKSQSNNLFTYELHVVVPVLANYSQKILKVVHDLSIYPAMLYHEQSGKEYSANNDAQFMANLGQVLSSDETRLIIAGLNAQVRLAEEDEND